MAYFVLVSIVLSVTKQTPCLIKLTAHEIVVTQFTSHGLFYQFGILQATNNSCPCYNSLELCMLLLMTSTLHNYFYVLENDKGCLPKKRQNLVKNIHQRD